MPTQRHSTVFSFGLLLCAAALAGPAAAGDMPWCSVPSNQAPAELPALLSSLNKQRDRPSAPLPRLHTEGTLPHQGIHDQTVAAKRDLPLMQNAALAWRMSGDEVWLQFAHRYLMAWVNTYQPSFNPIDETSFDTLIETFAIIQSKLPDDERRKVRQYLQDWGKGYVAAIDHHADHRGVWSNNWQSHRIKLITLIAVALDDPTLFADARRLFEQQIAANIAPSGEVLDFQQRDALHYVVYDLQPLVQAALAARTRGEDWYRWRTPDGASLASAVTWLTPYVSGQRTHEEFVHSQVRFDAIRAQAGLKGFAGPFDPHAANTLYWLISQLDPSQRALSTQLGKPPLSVRLCGM